VQYFGPVIEALKNLGGSGRPTEVKDLIAVRLDISDEEQNEQTESGSSRFSKNVDWARFYLAKAGYIGSSKRGVWNLTEKGYVASLSHNEALEVYHGVHSGFHRDDDGSRNSELAELKTQIAQEVEVPEAGEHRGEFLSRLQNLSPAGFERFCKRLLLEADFQDVEVTGRSSSPDGGIDGYGILQINRFMSFQVYFQCKKWSKPVSAPVVRDFRGAMMGRADKGIILTPGTFTREARKEAIRDGAAPIELVDGEKILNMVEELELGVTPRTVYIIDEAFFEEFENY
jgi:restriction system protein